MEIWNDEAINEQLSDESAVSGDSYDDGDDIVAAARDTNS